MSYALNMILGLAWNRRIRSRFSDTSIIVLAMEFSLFLIDSLNIDIPL